MLEPAPGQVDPVVACRKITAGQKVATMGSCFAQHLSRHIQSSGLEYYIAETAPQDICAEDAKRRNYGVFSARYGNVYTVRQANQLYDRAFDNRMYADDVWEKDGGFVDAFRPQIEPYVISSADEVRSSAKAHLQHVREVFTRCEWLVFTLGLTECWRSTLDGAIYPLAPGVHGGKHDPDKYEFVNFTAQQVQDDLVLFVENLRRVNPEAQILLTVSPVPLIATYEKRHVWVSTTYSKAALRVAADAVERLYDNVIYFPSYEIITSPSSGGRYYQDDLRQVTELGVRHVMRMFSRHFIENTPSAQICTAKQYAIDKDDEIVCDEEVIERALRLSGF